MPQIHSANEVRRVAFVAEDDPLMLEMVMKMLRRDGWEVHGFPDGGSALEAMEQCDPPPRLLITDYSMPGMNGLELVAQCRALVPDLKTLSISGTTDLPELALPSHRPDRFLPKPFTVTALLDAIHGLVDES